MAAGPKKAFRTSVKG